MDISEEYRGTYVYYGKTSVIAGVVFVVLFAVAMTLLSLGQTAACYAVCVAAGVALVVFLGFLGRLLVIRIYQGRCEDYAAEVSREPHRVMLEEGEQGVGKSENAKRIAVLLADKQYALLRGEYNEHRHMLPTYAAQNDREAIERYRESERCMRFYAAHPEVYPCLFTNVPMYVDGRACMLFSYGYLMQESNLGYRSVVLIDEVNNMLSNTDSKSYPRELDEALRFVRQFNNGYIVCTEQDKYKPLIALRRVCYNHTIMSFERVFSPKRLERKLGRLRAEFEEKYPTTFLTLRAKGREAMVRSRYLNLSAHGVTAFGGLFGGYAEVGRRKKYRAAAFERYAPYLYTFATEDMRRIVAMKQRIEGIGFIRYRRMERGSTQGNIFSDVNFGGSGEEIQDGQASRIKTYFVPSYRRYRCDTRLFRGIYKAKDKQFIPNVWQSPILTRDIWDEVLEYKDGEGKDKVAESMKHKVDKENGAA